MPFEWLVSIVCDEYHCLPSRAVNEVMNDPQGMALEIIRLRRYAQARDALLNAKSAQDIPKGLNIEQVMEIQAELMERGGQDGEHC